MTIILLAKKTISSYSYICPNDRQPRGKWACGGPHQQYSKMASSINIDDPFGGAPAIKVLLNSAAKTSTYRLSHLGFFNTGFQT